MYAEILNNRIRDIVEEKILEEQGAVRKKRSCTNQLFTVRLLSKTTVAKNERMTMECVDLEIAYDNVNSELVWSVLEKYEIEKS